MDKLTLQGTINIPQTIKGRVSIPDLIKGDRGESAYEVAVRNGFEGTETEWLESLHAFDILDGGDSNEFISGGGT